MIETFFKAGTLNSPAGFLASLLIGIAFGLVLEQAGFGSARRLAGIFYLRDMAVLKVMFTAVVSAMLGICYASAFGLVTLDNVHFLHAFYGAQIAGGLLFGAGFVMSGWCPGTGAVGLASGKIDALVFLAGAVGGSMLYNELHPLLSPIFQKDHGVVFAYDSLGVSKAGFAFVFTVIAVLCFWGSEYLEKKRHGRGRLWGTPFLTVLSVVLIVASAGLFMVEGFQKGTQRPALSGVSQDKALQEGPSPQAHLGPKILAERLLAGDATLLLVDIRTPEAFKDFHIRSAVNIPEAVLPESLVLKKNRGLIVLYADGTLPASRARESLIGLGFKNVSFLSGGVKEFVEVCLKPVSLRAEPVSRTAAARINAWRAFFLVPGTDD